MSTAGKQKPNRPPLTSIVYQRKKCQAWIHAHVWSSFPMQKNPFPASPAPIRSLFFCHFLSFLARCSWNYRHVLHPKIQHHAGTCNTLQSQNYRGRQPLMHLTFHHQELFSYKLTVNKEHSPSIPGLSSVVPADFTTQETNWPWRFCEINGRLTEGS